MDGRKIFTFTLVIVGILGSIFLYLFVSEQKRQFFFSDQEKGSPTKDRPQLNTITIPPPSSADSLILKTNEQEISLWKQEAAVIFDRFKNNESDRVEIIPLKSKTREGKNVEIVLVKFWAGDALKKSIEASLHIDLEAAEGLPKVKIIDTWNSMQIEPRGKKDPSLLKDVATNEAISTEKGLSADGIL